MFLVFTNSGLFGLGGGEGLRDISVMSKNSKITPVHGQTILDLHTNLRLLGHGWMVSFIFAQLVFYWRSALVSSFFPFQINLALLNHFEEFTCIQGMADTTASGLGSWLEYNVFVPSL